MKKNGLLPVALKGFFSVVLIAALANAPLYSQNSREADLLGKASINDLDAVKALIESGVNIDAQDEKYGYTPLLTACEHNYIDMVSYLLSKGADIGIRANDGSTALIRAALKTPDAVKLLLSAGADINARTNEGSGVVSQCVFGVLYYGHSMDLAEFLFPRVADIDEAITTDDSVNGYTTLFWCVRENHEELVRLLIKHGADLNAVAKDGMTPLKLAQKEGHQNMVAILKSNGAR